MVREGHRGLDWGGYGGVNARGIHIGSTLVPSQSTKKPPLKP